MFVVKHQALRLFVTQSRITEMRLQHYSPRSMSSLSFTVLITAVTTCFLLDYLINDSPP